MDEVNPPTVRFFHYLLESTPGKGDAERLSKQTVAAIFEDRLGTCTYEVPLDPRDRRVLVVIDGEPLWESIPKGGDVIQTVELGELKSDASHLRKPRFGTPWYRVDRVDANKYVATLTLRRHFLLLPAGTFFFCRVRDKRSLGPMYVMADVRKATSASESSGEPKGKGGAEVIWHHTTY